MLVLARRVGQTVVIGGTTVLKVLAISPTELVLDIAGFPYCLYGLHDRTRIADHVNVTIEWVGINETGDVIRLGFTAPTSVSIHRGEIQKRVDAESSMRGRTIGADGRDE